DSTCRRLSTSEYGPGPDQCTRRIRLHTSFEYSRLARRTNGRPYARIGVAGLATGRLDSRKATQFVDRRAPTRGPVQLACPSVQPLARNRSKFLLSFASFGATAMNVHQLVLAPSASLAARLDEFERQFRYPLGSGQTFYISHGDDYPRFFRAMGEACCLVAEQGERVIGVLSVVIRPLQHPDGSATTTAYFADLKLSPTCYRGRVLLRLFCEAQNWLARRATSA